MKPGEPILLICHFFPPVFDIGGRRWAKFAKELARRGHPVHVIRTTKRPNERDSLWAKDAEHPNIHHHPIPNRYPAVMTRWPLTSLWDKLAYRFWLKVLPLFTKGNYYDVGMLSRKDLLRTATALVKEHGIRNVIATGAPFSQLGFTLELKNHFPDLHIVADFRDEWTTADHYGLASIGKYRDEEERRMECQVVQSAHRITAPSALMLERLQKAHGLDASSSVILPHAVDPDDCPKSRSIPNKDYRFRIIYAGSLYGAGEAEDYFEQVLWAFSAFREADPINFNQTVFDLYITGQSTSAFQQQVEARGLKDKIRFHAPLSPMKIAAEINASNLVVIFIPVVNKDLLGTKFQEIFFQHKPILHVGSPGLVGQTLIKRKLGDSIRVEDLVTELPKIITGERKIDLDPNPDLSDVLLGPVTDKLIREVLA